MALDRVRLDVVRCPAHFDSLPLELPNGAVTRTLAQEDQSAALVADAFAVLERLPQLRQPERDRKGKRKEDGRESRVEQRGEF